jgi:hypothetical protein
MVTKPRRFNLAAQIGRAALAFVQIVGGPTHANGQHTSGLTEAPSGVALRLMAA